MSSESHEPYSAPPRPVWPIFLAGIIMILIFLGATELIRSWIPTGSTEQVELGENRIKNLQELQETNRKELENFDWVNKEAGTVRIPIQRAMELEIAALNTRSPEPAYAIDPLDLAPAAPSEAGSSQSAPQEASPAEASPADTANEPLSEDAQASDQTSAAATDDQPAATTGDTTAAPAVE